MSWAIVCDARKGRKLGIGVLALVDRRVTKKYWWTSDSPFHIMQFYKKAAAERQCRKLTRNNAEVVSYNDAVRWIREQSREIDHQYAMDDTEQGWDAHKGQF